MDIDRDKQLKIIEETTQRLHSTENKRMLLRFQRGVVDLENNRFEILQNSEFVEKFGEYLYTLYQKDPGKNILKILEKIGFCACSGDKNLRERAVFILSIFIEKISQEENNPEFLEVVSRLLVNWLQIETEYFSGFPFICLQLQTMLQKMLQIGLWYQTENLIIILSQIQKGIIQKNNLIRQTISKVHSCLAEEAFLKNLVDVYLDKKEDRRDIAQCLLLHFGSKAAAVLVQYLIDCKDRDKRFSLIEFIPTTGKVVLPVCDFCLKQNPPWYVVRNLIIIISRMEDPKLYEMVRPYLTHKDIRVQLQILHCITKLRGPQMRDRLLEALIYINDELKQQVVVQLGNMGGKDVGKALCTLLENRGNFARHVQDELILTICAKIKFEPSERAIKVVKELLAERIKRFNEGDLILQAARDALVSMELKNTGRLATGSHQSLSPTAPSDSEAIRIPIATEEEFNSLIKGEAPGTQEDLETPPAPSTASDLEESLANTGRSNPPSKEDIIQEAKRNLTDPHSAIHFTLWQNLYEEMTTDEFTIFYTTLKLKTYQPNELIIARGDLQAPLFLLNSGTVNLVRNQRGEEVTLSPIGPGDLIGSDIFLTGEAWNLSLYAKDVVSAHVFDLEHLLKMQTNFPNLAEKIFTFCSRYDVLQNLLRVLDTPATAGTDSTHIKMKDKSDKSANYITQQGTILRQVKGGLCFSLPIRNHEKIKIPLENKLNLSVKLSSGVVDSLPATVVGTSQSVTKPAKSVVFSRFLSPLTNSQYVCKNIEFL
jgi:CRP-like cAMP-binding protein